MLSITNSYMVSIVVVSAIIWQYLNGSLQADAIISMTDPPAFRGLTGLFLFTLGMTGNIWHDKVLSNLRRHSNERKKYSIPYGGLYEFISFPNYLCEWIEWSGYALCLAQPAGT